MERNASLAARIATVLAGGRREAKSVMEMSPTLSPPSTYSVLCVGSKAIEGVAARAMVMLPDVAIQSSERSVSEVIGESKAMRRGVKEKR